jgi:hypothetical protein
MPRAQPPPRSSRDEPAFLVVPPVVPVPAGAPGWVTPELLAQTLRVWQPDYEHTLTVEDVLEMMLNVGQLFDVLSRGNDREAVRRIGPRVEP